MMKVLILGASGFVGRNVKEYLQKKNTQYEVFAPSSRELNCVDEETVNVESALRIFLNFAKKQNVYFDYL